MADELSRLGVSWVEESTLRADVVAAVNASADAEATADEAELQRRWSSLEEMERIAAELLQQSANTATRARGLAVLGSVKNENHGKSGEDEDGAEPALQFRLARAQREVESRAKLLRNWQLEMETRQRQRLEEARRRKQMEENVELERRARVASANVSSSGLRTATAPPPHLGVAASLGALTSAASKGVSTLSVARETRYPQHAAAPPSSAALAVQSGFATVLPPRRESGICGGAMGPMTVEEYSGGSLLPSLHRVSLKRSDLHLKSLRYTDDGDLGTFHARQQKRQRLEKIAASMEGALRRLPSPSPDDDVKMKIARDNNSVVKKEDNSNEINEMSGASRFEAIDVDALMEGADEVSEDALQLALKKNNGKEKDDSDVEVKGEKNVATVSIISGISLPASIHQRLLDYQQDGVRWMLQLHIQRTGGILGDEMGLGKTIQVAAMLNALHFSQQLRGPCLIVSPLTVLQQWVAEMHRWAPYMRTCIMHENSASNMSRDQLITSVRGTPAVVLATYAAVRQHCQLLHTAGFQYVILDEGHKISNPEATVTLAVKSFPTLHRLVLSGTPIQNTLKELWCLFDFVKPGLLGTMSRFVEEFEEPINASKNVRASSLMLATAVECARTLQERIAPYLLRRLKRQVLSHALPQKYERVIRCPLSDAQLETYVELLTSPRVQKLLSNTLSSLQIMGGLNRDGRDASGSLHLSGNRFRMMRGNDNNGGIRLEAFRVLNELRQICNHVDVFCMRQAAISENEDLYDDNDVVGVGFPVVASHTDKVSAVQGQWKQLQKRASRPSLRSNRSVNYAGSGKLQTLHKLLTVWQRGGQRVLIFSQTRMMLDIIENMCEQEGFTYIRIDGRTNSHHRQELMDRFNQDDRIIAALLTTRVGGVGVNLIGADRVVLFDPDWNPVTDEQARERAWRIGQTRDVGVYRLIASGTVEEAILRRQLAKTYVTEKVLHDPALQRFFHQQESLSETFYLGAEYESRIPAGKKHIMAAQELSPLLVKEEEEEKDAVDGVQRQEAGVLGRIVQRETDAAVYRVQVPGAVAAPVSSAEVKRESAPKTETALLQDLVDGQEVRVSGVDAVARRLARLSAAQTMSRVVNTTRTIQQQQNEMQRKMSEKPRRKTGAEVKKG